jgi:hypothetical protein
MHKADFVPFTELLDATCGLLSRGNYTPNSTNSAMWFKSLEKYPLEAVRAGFDAHVRDPQRGRFVPVPADVIAQIDSTAAADGRLGAEEAWALALGAQDEAETVVWTTEIAQALGIAKPILDAGDEVGARMAFKEAYARLVDEARRNRVAASWSASLGWDKTRRDVAVRAAIDAGRLPLTALPAPEPAVPLLALAESNGAPPELRAKLQQLRDEFAGKTVRPSHDAIARAETDRLKEEMAKRVQEYAAAHGISLEDAESAVKPEGEPA